MSDVFLIALLPGNKALILTEEHWGLQAFAKKKYSLFFYKHQGGVYAFLMHAIYVCVYIYISIYI